MSLSAKQGAVMMELQASGTMTLVRAVELVGGDIYANQSKHVGDILSRMVRRKLIERIKPGLFKLSASAPKVEAARGWWQD